MNAPDESDWDLLTEYRAGDERAAAQLYRRHFQRITQVFTGIAAADAEDLIQITFSSAFKVSRESVHGDDFRAYLVGIARKKRADYMTRQSRKRTLPELDSNALHAHEFIITKRQDRVLLEALRALTPVHQEVISLRYWGDASIDEIAELLDIPRGTVKSRLNRACAALKPELKKVEKNAHLLNSTSSTVRGWATTIIARLDGNEGAP
jgi:RNA polymerase sigma-70 factor (ECF subfamily)